MYDGAQTQMSRLGHLIEARKTLDEAGIYPQQVAQIDTEILALRRGMGAIAGGRFEIVSPAGPMIAGRTGPPRRRTMWQRFWDWFRSAGLEWGGK